MGTGCLCILLYIVVCRLNLLYGGVVRADVNGPGCVKVIFVHKHCGKNACGNYADRQQKNKPEQKTVFLFCLLFFVHNAVSFVLMKTKVSELKFLYLITGILISNRNGVYSLGYYFILLNLACLSSFDSLIPKYKRNLEERK